MPHKQKTGARERPTDSSSIFPGIVQKEFDILEHAIEKRSQ